MAPTALDVEMKVYERATDQRIDGSSICLIRLDGVGFSKYTRQPCFERPFSKLFARAMLDTARALCERFDPQCIYTSSDEITMILKRTYDIESKAYKPYIYNGRVQKLASISAATATAAFNDAIKRLSTNNATPEGLALFDSRVFTVPDQETALRNIQWRSSHDAARNSFARLVQHFLGAKKVHDLSPKELADELHAKFRVSWYDLDTHYRYGTLVRKVASVVKATDYKTGKENLIVRRSIAETPLTDELVKNDAALMETLFERC